MKLKRWLMICIFGLSSCSSPSKDLASPSPAPVRADAPKKPKKPEEEKKPPEEKWVCKLFNGEGRVFRSTEDSRTLAEAKARQECQLYSRHCNQLDCSVTTEEE